MRLDKFLKVSRLIKRRTMANEACDAGRVSLNGKVARASVDVKAGDIIEISFGDRSVKARVKAVMETIHKEDAEKMVELIWFNKVLSPNLILRILSVKFLSMEKI